MIGAFVVGGVVLLAIVGIVVGLAVALGNARVNDATKAGRIAILEAEVRTQTARGDSEERRADALDDELARVAEDGDVDGARGRVLARYRIKAGLDPVPAAGDGSSSVHDGAPAITEPRVDRDGLEQP